MRIHHIQGLFATEHGGPTHSLRNYCLGQARLGHEVSAWVLKGMPNTSSVRPMPQPIATHIFQTELPSILGRSGALRRHIASSQTPDIYHLHGTWLRAMYYGAVEARHRKVPYLVETMGMYEPYGLRQKWLRKRFARYWFQDAILRDASCLHVNSDQEAQNLRRLGFSKPVAVLPVGIRMPVTHHVGSPVHDSPLLSELSKRPFVLFLSRIHSKKGIELLLRAWADVHKAHPAVMLVVAGTGDPAYLAKCRQKTEELGIAERCFWPGQVTDEQKKWLLSHARLLALPTYSENYGNVVAEALAHGTPVITTNATPWLEVVSRGCGWIVPVEIVHLTEALRIALSMSPEALRGMGIKGRVWAEKSFSVENVLSSLDQVYRWLLGNGSKPDCVQL
jgi:glycosyltransferase involved in cell wall biosynthesis